MNLWIIGVIIAGLLLIGGAMVVKANLQETPEPKELLSCSNCGGNCDAEKNCGLSTCGAINGGSCGCKNR